MGQASAEKIGPGGKIEPNDGGEVSIREISIDIQNFQVERFQFTHKTFKFKKFQLSSKVGIGFAFPFGDGRRGFLAGGVRLPQVVWGLPNGRRTTPRRL